MSTAFLRRTVAMCTLAFVAAITPATSAQAQRTAWIPDRVGDADARIDITSVKYRNTTWRYESTVRVRDLRNRGEFSLIVNRLYAGDIYAIASVRRRADGTLRTSFYRVDRGGSVAHPCAVRAVWNRAENYVRIQMPRSCAGRVTESEKMELRASAYLYNREDLARLVRLSHN